MPTTNAPSGKKTITIEVQFFTNNLAKGRVLPKHAHAAGMIRVRANPMHGIKAAKQEPFHSMAAIPVALEKLLRRTGIRIHPTPKMGYLTAT